MEGIKNTSTIVLQSSKNLALCLNNNVFYDLSLYFLFFFIINYILNIKICLISYKKFGMGEDSSVKRELFRLAKGRRIES